MGSAGGGRVTLGDLVKLKMFSQTSEFCCSLTDSCELKVGHMADSDSQQYSTCDVVRIPMDGMPTLSHNLPRLPGSVMASQSQLPISEGPSQATGWV